MARRAAAAPRGPLVVHAPTNRAVKGTHHVLAALDALRAEGVAFELRLVEGLTHDEARRVYAQADLVVDQLLLGWYGGLAVECMALGVPVDAHIRQPTWTCVPRGDRADLPILNATPATDPRRAAGPGSVGQRPSCRSSGARGARSSSAGTIPGSERHRRRRYVPPSPGVVAHGARVAYAAAKGGV